MRAVQFDTVGLPSDVLTLRDIPTPTPAAGEVLIRVRARSINPSDLSFVRGFYGITAKPPCGAGFEAMGVVEQLGEGVDASIIPIGTRVCFTALGGVWQEYVAANARAVIKLPDAISDETGCQLFVNPFTAWAMLHETGLQAGEWLLQTAGASTFGQLVITLAKLRGIKTISTVRRADQVDMLKALGADEVIVTETEHIAKRVREITGGAGVKAALEAVGGKTGARALQALARNGVMLVYGSLSLEDIPVNSGVLIFKNLTIKGFWLTEWMERVDSKTRREVGASLMELFVNGTLKAPVDAKYDLADIKKAVTHAETPGRNGKILLVG